MKKLICVVLCIVLVASLAAVFTGCQYPREEVLKLYVPGEYMDEEIFAEFEDWYAEEYGKTIHVKVETFEAVEDVQLAVEDSHADFDLLCPSDYMVEYLIDKGLLQKVDKTMIDITKGGLIRSEYLETSKEFDPTLEYSVPYMYGTLGLVYDYSKTGEKIDSWEALFGTKYEGKRSIKDSIRDAYVSACLYNARGTLTGLSGDAQKAAVQAVFEDTSAATVAAAGETLMQVKRGGAKWDVDDVKFDMAAGKGTVVVALMWSCDAGYVMNDYEDADGNNQSGNRNLWYVVPKEGGNVYIDSFVINKYAVNYHAANAFLAFLCRQDVAVRNSTYAGAISPVAAAYDELLAYYTEDEDGLFADASAEWKAMFIDAMFPSAATLNRCGVMKDFGAGKAAVDTMWSNVQ